MTGCLFPFLHPCHRFGEDSPLHKATVQHTLRVKLPLHPAPVLVLVVSVAEQQGAHQPLCTPTPHSSNLVKQSFQLVDKERVRVSLWQEPVIPNTSKGAYITSQFGTEIALAMYSLGDMLTAITNTAYTASPAPGLMHVLAVTDYSLDEDGRGDRARVGLGPGGDVV